MSQLIELTGRRFGYWTVEGVAEREPTKSGGSKVFWWCRCDCGVRRKLLGHYVRSGESRSCGCATNRYKSDALYHVVKRDHPREYRIWMSMKARCKYRNRPSTARYLDRGIVVCDRWEHSFESFLADMGPAPTDQHSIDRVDNDGPYEPGNCRWATTGEQARNSSQNHLITIDGVTKTLGDWSDERGFKRGTVERRINFLGWTPEEALSRPPRRWGR